MEKIREGKEKQEKVLEKAKKFLTHLLADFKKKEKEIGKEIIKSIKETWDNINYMGPCPKCKGRLMLKRGKFGRFVACDKYPKCKVTFHVPKMGKLKYTEKQCEICNHPIIEAGTGRNKRASCINQECSSKHSKEAPKEHALKNGSTYKEEGMTCPTCKEGKMVLRKSFYGEFLGCNNYPKCQTMMKIVHGKVDKENPIVKNNVKKKSDETKNKK